MKKMALIIMMITIASKIIGFGREIVLSYYFGATYITDAYIIALTMPSVIVGFVGAGIMTAYIPMQTRIIENSGVGIANRYTSNLVNIVIILLSIILIMIFCFAPFLVKLFAYGFTDEVMDIAVSFTRIMLVGIYFSILISIFTGFLQVNNNFIAPSLIGFPLNVVVIASIIIASTSSPYMLAWGTLIAMISQFVLLIPFIMRKKYKHFRIIKINDEYIKKTLLIAIPVIIGTSVSAVNVIVDRTIASTLAVGGISSLNYANKLIGFVTGLFIASIITVLYPTISKYASEKDYDSLKSSIVEAINLIIIFIIPITMGTLLFCKPVIWMIYGRGAFEASAIEMTSSALFYYAMGFLGIGLMDVFTRAFYAMQNTKTPMIYAAIGVIINIVLNIVLSRVIGLGGLALATSISLSVVAVLLFLAFRRKVGPFGMKEVVINIGKVTLASAIMGVFAKVTYEYLLVALQSNMAALLFAISVGAVVYFIIIYFMKIRDVDIMVNAVKIKLKGIMS